MHSLLWRFENESHKSSRALQLASYGGGAGVAEHVLTVTSWLSAGSVSRPASRAREEVTASVKSQLRMRDWDVRTHTHTHTLRLVELKEALFCQRGAHMFTLCPLFIITFPQFITWTKAGVWIMDKIASVCLPVSRAHVMQWRFCPVDGASRLALRLFLFIYF